MSLGMPRDICDCCREDSTDPNSSLSLNAARHGYCDTCDMNIWICIKCLSKDQNGIVYNHIATCFNCKRDNKINQVLNA